MWDRPGYNEEPQYRGEYQDTGSVDYGREDPNYPATAQGQDYPSNSRGEYYPSNAAYDFDYSNDPYQSSVPLTDNVSEAYSEYNQAGGTPHTGRSYDRPYERGNTSYDTYPASNYNSDYMPASDYDRDSQRFPNDNGSYQARSSTGSMYEDYAQSGAAREPYPTWTPENQVPITKEQIEDVFIDLTNKFGFQRESMRNIYDHFMTMLDSRASRMTPAQALLSLHADYIGGENANYRKWYFAAQIDLDDEVGFRNMKLGKTSRRMRKARKKSKLLNTPGKQGEDNQRTLEELEGDYSLEAGEFRWKTRMNQLSSQEKVRQIALYLLCWGEANQVRFTPECLCYIYKCADDYFLSADCQNRTEPVPEGEFLNRIITPLYRFIRAQVYEIVEGRYVRRERDHNKTIGYDDVNQLFWYPEGIERIVFEDGSRMVDLPHQERFWRLGDVVWKNVFFKTYKETRSWFHMATNFNRIWVFHITAFWFYTSYNSPSLYTRDYTYLANPSPLAAMRWAVVALGGTIACLLQILATVCEWAFVPRVWPGAQHLSMRLLFLVLMLCLNFVTPAYVLMYVGYRESRSALIVGIVGFIIALLTFIYFTIVPLGGLFGSYLNKRTRRYVASQTFTASVPPLTGVSMWLSYLVWIVVFGAKLAESYFFLTLSLRDPIHDLGTMEIRCIGEVWFGDVLCKQQARIILGILYATDLVLFFLDTYLWYIIVNTILSVGRSFYLGISILTPWRNIFSRLPKRIYSKVLATNDMEIKYKPKVLISQVWNAIIISMYREHLLSINHVQMLLYHQVPSEVEGKRALRAPTFFVNQDDNQVTAEFFPAKSEAERRISFFAQSLSTPMAEPMPVDNMPTFTVLVPHYSEKILLSLREIIREEDQYTRLTLLEYLKQLHPNEWDCFVKDTKILAEEFGSYADNDEKDMDREAVKNKIDDLPFYCIGFKNAAPEYTLRTRIWASLRSQTLYRTVSGFMNYSRAIKLLYRIENPEVVQMFGGNADRLEMELERMVRRKFKFVVAMQRLTKFRADEMENAEFLLRAYPDLQIAYLDEEPPVNEGEEPRVFSALIDGHCEIMENGRRRPKFRVQISGNPILGDGKSDNQNHVIIFCRGEYLQLIDANQDNYLEECLKVRSVLSEFEEFNMDVSNPYTPGLPKDKRVEPESPVAIVGAREYIFSESSGVLGDVAAGKEQTFGTLFARTMASIGGKLHYGHPDFLNNIFMTTRGGVSKAQKGLHLNEDIYAGMTALMRGGRIKHCEYFQCGKGRDLGFSSILNFTTKIGAGMGEQMLSREYYYLGTQLPLDRFLLFFYAHPGFHINNMFVVVSIQMFMICLMNIGALSSEAISCHYNRDLPQTDPHVPVGCYMLTPVRTWIDRCVLSIFIVFFISFIPLVVQELCEKGLWRAVLRFSKHILSFTPLFEVFVCQVYASSLVTNLSFGGARYIATGRGMATARIPFSVLFTRFASDAIYLGSRSFMMLLFGTVSMWRASLLWFWLTMVSLVISPFIYNPHQFSWTDFFVDYRDFIRWLSRGNTKWHRNSWIGYVRYTRTRITGYKRKLLGDPAELGSNDHSRVSFGNLILTEILIPIVVFGTAFIPFLFVNAKTGVIRENNEDRSDADLGKVNSVLRVLICSLGPVAVNAGVVLVLVFISCFAGPLTGLCCKRTAAVMAGIAHAFAVIIQIIFFEVMWFFEGFVFYRALIGTISCVLLQRLVCKLLIGFCLTREYRAEVSNRAWWSGKWYGNGLGWWAWTQPLREFLCKIVEMEMFGGDFILGHFILFLQLPALLIPKVDKWHSMLVFWLGPHQQVRPPIFSMKQNRLRKRMVRKYASMYFVILIIFIAAFVGPAVAKNPVEFAKELNDVTDITKGLVQPVGLKSNDTGDSRADTATFLTETPDPSSRTFTSIP